MATAAPEIPAFEYRRRAAGVRGEAATFVGFEEQRKAWPGIEIAGNER